MILRNILDGIGKTPIVSLSRLFSDSRCEVLLRTLIPNKNLILFMEYGIMRIIRIIVHRNFTSIVRKLHKSCAAFKNLPTVRKIATENSLRS